MAKAKKEKVKVKVIKKGQVTCPSICPMCGSDNVVCSETEYGLVCKDCGHVFQELSPEDEERLEDASDVI